MGQKQTYFTFEDTLSQIGLGYTFLFALAVLFFTRSMDRTWRHPRSATGRPSLCTRLPAAVSISARSVFDPTGHTIRADSLRIGTRTATSAWAVRPWFLNLFPAGPARSSPMMAAI